MTYDILEIVEHMAAQLAVTLGNPGIPERLRIANDVKQAAHAAFGQDLPPKADIRRMWAKCLLLTRSRPTL